MSSPVNYATTDGTFRVSAKRFAQSPWLGAYRTDAMVLGVYSNRFYPLTLGEDPVADYWRLRRGAVLFDVPEHPIEIAGPDSAELFRRLFCRDVSGLRVGRATYAIACNQEGGIVMDGVLLRLGEQRFWYVLASGDFLGWLDAHRAGFDVSVTDPNAWVLQVQGPRSLEGLAALLDGPPPQPFKYFDVAECSVDGEPFLISRTGWTGELGFELYSLNPQVDGQRVFHHLMHAGRAVDLGFSSLESMGIRRIEAGIMDNGTDMDATMTPFQAGLGRFVDVESSDYIGSEALARADKRNCFYGVIAASETPIGRHKAVCEGIEVGQMTAAAVSPYLKKFIGYLRFDEPGDWVDNEVTLLASDGSTHVGKVVSLPFFDTEKRLPRGLAAPGEFDE